MEVQKVIRKIHKLKAENSTLEYRLKATQEYIEQLKRQKFLALLIGLLLGYIVGIFGGSLLTWIIKF